MCDWERFDKALFRCLAEVQLAVAEQWAQLRLEQLMPETRDPRTGFYGVAAAAFSSSTEMRLALVLDETKDEKISGFWWLHKNGKEKISAYTPEDRDIEFLKAFSKRLCRLRHNTLAHIGKEAMNLKDLRRKVRITPHEFHRAATLTKGLLWDLHDFRCSSGTWTMNDHWMERFDYQGSDIASILGVES